MMQSTNNHTPQRKKPCSDCKMCQNCSDSRCNACRGDGLQKPKLSIREQIALYDRLNPGLSDVVTCACKRHHDTKD